LAEAVDVERAQTSPIVRSKRPATEFEVVAQIVKHAVELEAHIGPIQLVGLEVRTHGTSRADVLIFASDLVAIEAKLTDWNRALGQAVLNTTVVDQSYVAMWAGYIAPGLLKAADEYGVGVIAVHDDGLEILVKAGAGTPDATARAVVLDRLSRSSRSDAGGM
jgi:hypothetical protein